MKVAILGASGIGKNHARWFAGHGCDIAAFLASSVQSLESTRALLHQTIGFSGPGYLDLDELLQSEKPDIVCISNPPRFHYHHAQQCLLSGAHLLCEKPLVGDDVQLDARFRHQFVAEGTELVKLADEKNCVFGTQMQYASAAPIVEELAGVVGKPLTQWEMILETKNVRPGRAGAQIWIDLSPHPLSVLQKTRAACIDWNTASCVIEEMQSEARFQARLQKQSEPCDVKITVRCNPTCEVPLRRFTLNGNDVDLNARKNADGDFKAFWSNAAQTIEQPDLVDDLIGNFVRACRGEEELKVTGEDGARNVEWQLRLLELA
ncbi:MAG TPA: Gfo/Idh/MocA family oxidoreductase [Abditibacteriaceae bacterium]|jgi:hypothetical protein